MPVTAGLVIGGLTSAFQIGTGISQKAKAAKLAKMKRPVLTDNPYIEDMYSLTGSNASQGLSDTAKDAYITNNDRNLSSSLDAILRSGGTPNNIGDVYDRSTNGLRKLALVDDEAKNRNLMQYIQFGLMPKADEKRDEFMVNEMAPFQDNAQLVKDLSEQGMNNIWKGINTGGNTVLKYADSKAYGDNKDGAQGSGTGNNFTTADLMRFRRSEVNMGARSSANGGTTYRPHSLLNYN